ncbi:MAG: glycosyltransferase family 4 protein [Ardenticatenales bacterium]|nr:glycosyltransferase family 4 protein [Ardenticatenales bacterium]
MTQTRILIISNDIVGSNMAGPGIRSLELARVLSKIFDVVLAAPNESDLPQEAIRLHPYQYHHWDSLRPALEGVDVIFATGFALQMFAPLLDFPLPIVIDLYDPFPLENLYLFEEVDTAQKQQVYQTDLSIVDVMCRRGDYFVCANERQRDWWLGVLQAKGRINALTAGEDPSLRRLVDVLAFGLPSRLLATDAPGPRELLPAISLDDPLILWGGGLWAWLDPITLIQAMPLILAEVPRAKLLFPGTRHPNSLVPMMKRTVEAIALAEQMGLTEQSIFFGEWIPYDSWTSYVMQSDVAISLHYDTLETQFSAVRSRILSYIWAGLPMVVTEGDAASRLVQEYHLGEVVPYEDVEGVAEAIVRVLRQGKAPYRAGLDAIAPTLTWEEVARPLMEFCHAPRLAPDRVAGWVTSRAEVNGHSNHIQQQQLEIAQLRQTIQAYEQGRFIRLMQEVERLKRKLFSF